MKRIATILFLFAALVATAQTRRSKVDYLQIRLDQLPATIPGSGTIFYSATDSLLKMRMTDGSIFIFGDTATGAGDYSPFDTTATAIIQKDTTLNVGIGTTTPGGKFQVEKSGYALYVDSGYFVYADTSGGSTGSITWTPDGGAMAAKRYDVINGISYISDDSTDISLEVGQRRITGGAHVAQIEFHSNAATNEGHIHLDVIDTADNEIQLHVETSDSVLRLSTTGTAIGIDELAGNGAGVVGVSNDGSLFYSNAAGGFIEDTLGNYYTAADFPSAGNNLLIGIPNIPAQQ